MCDERTARRLHPALAVLATLGLAASSCLAAAEGCPVPPADAHEHWFGEAEWQALQDAGFVIGDITFDTIDVYETETPEQDRWYTRAINALHVETRPGALKPLLLFETGQPVDASLIYQSERRLRALKYLRAARIMPMRCADGRVTVEVETRDAWSLKFGLDFKSTGGESSSQFIFSDSNVFGTGKHLLFRRANETERTRTTYGYGDQSLFGSRWRLFVTHGDLSDGVANDATLWLPFVTNASPYAVTLRGVGNRQTLTFYENTDAAWRTRSTDEEQEIGAGMLLDWNGRAGWRAGLRFHHEAHDYDPLEAVEPTLRPAPELTDRRLRGFIASLTRFHDEFHTYRNLRTIDRTEDHNLGLDVNFDLGYFPTDYSSSIETWSGAIDATWAGNLGAGLVLADLRLATRREPGESRDAFTHVAGAWYSPRSATHTRLVRLAYDQRDDPDPEHMLYLGDLDGLLGYPNHFRAVDRGWNLHIAERVVTTTSWFQTLRVGWTVFVEAAQGRSVVDGRWTPVYTDVGGGFRLGNLRGTETAPIFLSVAIPIEREHGQDKYQLVLGTAIEF